MAVPDAVTAFNDAATAFSSACLAAMGTGDSSLGTQLEALPALCEAAISAIRAATTVPEAGAAVTACERTLANCAALGDAVLASLPPVEIWTVPQPMPADAILTRFYGAAGRFHFDEFVGNNPIILGTPLIPAGTVLRLARS